MTQGGHAAAVRRTARIDLGVIRENLRRVLERDPDVVLDARGNAFGHGVIDVVRAAIEVGVGTVWVSPQDAVLPGIRRSALMTVAPRRTVVSAEAYGLTGEGPASMTVSGEIIAVKRAAAGVGVSYGYTYRTAADSTLALVALGYADGIPRLASNRTEVTVGGTRLPLVGRVAMDQFVVDCGEYRPAVGDVVTVFGSAAEGHPTAVEWAGLTGRSPLDLTAGIGSRVLRVIA